MKRPLVPMLLLIVCAGTLCAAAPAIHEHVVITDLPIEPGDYYLLLRRSADGSVSVVRIPQKQVISLEHGPDAPVPPDDGLALLRAAVTEATRAVVDDSKVAAKRALARMYVSLAGLPFQNREALQKSTDLMFAVLGLTNSWDAWKAAVDVALAEFTILSEATAAWRVVAEVLSRE